MFSSETRIDFGLSVQDALEKWGVSKTEVSAFLLANQYTEVPQSGGTVLYYGQMANGKRVRIRVRHQGNVARVLAFLVVGE